MGRQSGNIEEMLYDHCKIGVVGNGVSYLDNQTDKNKKKNQTVYSSNTLMGGRE